MLLTGEGRRRRARPRPETPRRSRAGSLSVSAFGSRTGNRTRRSVAPAATRRGTGSIVRSASMVPVVGLEDAQVGDDLQAVGRRAGCRDALAHRRDRLLDLGRVVAPRNPPQPEAAQPVDDPCVDRAAHPDRHAARLQRLRHHVDAVEVELRRPVARPRARSTARCTPRACDRAGGRAGRSRGPAASYSSRCQPTPTPRSRRPPDKHVERRRGLGEHDRTAQRREQDAGREPHAFGRSRR